jgi:hypothetical protein
MSNLAIATICSVKHFGESNFFVLYFILYCFDSISSYSYCFAIPTTTHESQDWQIYVDQSKASLDRGGGAIFDAIFSLCDTSVDDFVNANGDNTNGAVEVQVIPAILPKPASGGKGPWIRCVWNTNNLKNLARTSPNLDVSNVDSVEKVYRVLTKHLGVTVRILSIVSM